MEQGHIDSKINVAFSWFFHWYNRLFLFSEPDLYLLAKLIKVLVHSMLSSKIYTFGPLVQTCHIQKVEGVGWILISLLVCEFWYSSVAHSVKRKLNDISDGSTFYYGVNGYFGQRKLNAVWHLGQNDTKTKSKLFLCSNVSDMKSVTISIWVCILSFFQFDSKRFPFEFFMLLSEPAVHEILA